jgi:hypothetical protein
MKILEINRHDIEKWDELLKRPVVDLGEEEYPEDACLFCHTVKFDDGTEADLKVCSGKTNLWCEMVWFDKDGGQLTCSDPCNDKLEGLWPCSIDGHDVLVMKKGNIVLDRKCFDEEACRRFLKNIGKDRDITPDFVFDRLQEIMSEYDEWSEDDWDAINDDIDVNMFGIEYSANEENIVLYPVKDGSTDTEHGEFVYARGHRR